MFRNSVKILPLGLLSTLVFSYVGCNRNFSTQRTSGGSHVSDISVGISGIDSLKDKDGNQPVTGLHLTVTPESGCSGGVPIDQVVSTKSPIVLNLSVPKGCAYNASCELGSLSGDKLSDVYYTMTSPLNITAAQSQADKIPVRLAVKLTTNGTNLGLPENAGNTPPTPSTPGSNLTALPTNIDVQITTDKGSVKLSDYFTTEYLLIDFSRLGCPPCVSMAQENESSAEFKKMTSGASKCRAMTIVPSGSRSDWTSTIGGESAKDTIEYTGDHNAFATLFGTSISATPTFLLVDRQGKIVDQATGNMPSQFSELCK